MDFDVSVFIISSDNQYIPADEYNKGINVDGMFVMLTNDELNQEFGDDNSICIYTKNTDVLQKAKEKLPRHIIFFDHDGYVSSSWQTGRAAIPGTFKLNQNTDDIGNIYSSERDDCMRQYLDGYKTNMEIIRNVTPWLDTMTIDDYLPAIMLAHYTEVTFCGKTLHGYLPQIGQLLFIEKNIALVNTTLKTADSHASLFPTDKNQTCFLRGWWSAMEFDDGSSWYISNGTSKTYAKIHTLSVLPLFTL